MILLFSDTHRKIQRFGPASELFMADLLALHVVLTKEDPRSLCCDCNVCHIVFVGIIKSYWFKYRKIDVILVY